VHRGAVSSKEPSAWVREASVVAVNVNERRRVEALGARGAAASDGSN
jgi:hypothetical protein